MDRIKRAVGSGQWEVVLLLWLAFFLNQADRQVFNVSLPLIRSSMGLSDIQLGLIATGFTIVFGLMVPLAGIAGDIFPKARLVVASLLVFSLGTLLTGFSSSYVLLFLFRSIATGAGEAFYFPSATALIGEHHATSSGRAIGLHQTANYTGIIAGSLLAGWLAERFGWRFAFGVFGAAGLLWAGLLALRLRDAPTQRERPKVADSFSLVREALARAFGDPRILAQMAGFAGMAFMVAGYLTWMPTILYERFAGSLASSAFSSVFYHHLGAYAAIVLAGYLGDRLAAKFARARLFIMAFAMLGCVPFIALSALSTQQVFIYLGLLGFGVCRGFYDANQFAAVFDIVEPRLRSTIVGIVISCGFLVGAFAPLLMGMLKAQFGLQASLLTLAVAAAIGGSTILAATFAARPATPSPATT